MWQVLLASVLKPLAGAFVTAGMSMLARLMTAKCAEWVIRKAARQIVEATETKADDIWLDGLEKHLNAGMEKSEE